MSETPPNRPHPSDPAQYPAAGAPAGGPGGHAGSPQQPVPPGGPMPPPAPQGPPPGPQLRPPSGPQPAPGAPMPGGQAPYGPPPAQGAPAGAAPGTPGYAPTGPGTPPPSAEDPTWAMVAHLSGLIMACLGWLPALLVHAVQKHRSPFTRAHTSEAVNFQITLLLPYAVAWVAYIAIGIWAPQLSLVGSLLIAAVWAVSILFGVLAAMRANKGGWYRYPLTLRLVK